MFTAKVRRTQHGDGLDAIIKRVNEAASGPTRVRVGFIPGKAEADVVARAKFNEFGTSRIPERPFMRTSLRLNRDGYRQMKAADAKKVLRGEMLLTTALRRLGWKAKNDIQAVIESSMPPANAPSTVAKKNKATTLIDSGEMHRAVDYQIEDA